MRNCFVALTALLFLFGQVDSSVEELLEHFDKDGSGGLSAEEVEHYLEHLRGEDVGHCVTANDILGVVNATGDEATSEEALAGVLVESVSCILEVYCGTEFEIEVDEEVYICYEHDHDEEEQDEEEEEEHEHEGEVTLTAGINDLECEHLEGEEEVGNTVFTTAIWARSLFVTLGVCMLSLAGVVLLIFGIDPASMSDDNPILSDMLSFALGVLLWATLVHIIPEGVEGVEADLGFGNFVMLGVLVGAVTELAWPAVFAIFNNGEQPPVHNHYIKDDEAAAQIENKDEAEVVGTYHASKTAPIIANIIFGDFLHNYVDGVIIALAFGVCNSVSLGTSVTVGIIAHELPQEFSDFLVLVKCGLSYRKALLFNLLSSASALFGAITILSAGEMSSVTQGRLLLVSGGILLFIVLSELYPMISATVVGNTSLLRRLLFIGVGVGLGVVINEFVAHEHCHIGHDHGSDGHEGHDH
eukprot:snap_masked-scaffold_1-processed-gene-3.28-mRNA-1 protein AED:1.00 eAED:1.00 QI:0/-1/0/0/-1/1/1/0/470